MTILSTSDIADIRRGFDMTVAILAYQYRCTQSDIRAALETQPAPAFKAPVTAEETAPVSPETAPSGEAPMVTAAGESPVIPSAQGSNEPLVTVAEGANRGGDDVVPSIPELNTHDDRPNDGQRADAGLIGGAVEAGATGKSVGEQSPAAPVVKSNADIIRADIAAHPNSTAAEIAARTGLRPNSISATARVCKLAIRKLTPAEKKAKHSAAATARWDAQGRKPTEPLKPAGPTKPKRMTLADQIRAHLVDHPDATLGEVTAAIGGKMQAIGWAAQRAGIVLRKRTADERSEASARGARVRIRAAVQTQVAPPADDAVRPDETVMPEAADLRRVRPSGPPSGRFYLRDKVTGHYAHQALQKSPTGPGVLMTSDRKWAWYDTMERYRGAKKVWPELATMRKEAAQP